MTFDESTVCMRFAVVSDLHMHDVSFSASNLKFARTLGQLYAAAGGRLDALVIAGDITDWGTEEQIRQFDSVIRSKLKPETVLIAALGNHDVQDNYNVYKRGGKPFYKILGNRMYAGAAPEEIAVGNYHRVIHGMHFIALTLRDYHSGKHETEDLVWLRCQLEKAQEDSPGNRIFLATHPVIPDTVYGSNEGTYWHSTNLAEVLKDYPQTVVFSGHLHYPLNDERIIYQDGYTAVGTSAVYYGSLHPKYKGVSYIEINSGMEPYDSQVISQGLIVEVDGQGATRIRRYDFTADREIKQPWILPPVMSGLQPYAAEARRSLCNPPRFPEGAAVKIISFSPTRMRIKFPAAFDEDMVNSYEVTLRSGNGEIGQVMTYSDFYHHAKVEDMSRTVERVITAKNIGREIFEPAYTVEVRAMNSFGVFSEPIRNIPENEAEQVPDCPAILPTLMTDTICRKIYDFDFWEQGNKNIGTINDTTAYVSECDGAGQDFSLEAVPSGTDGGNAMKLTIIRENAAHCFHAIYIKATHPENVYAAQTYPDSTAFSFYVDATNWTGNLKIYPMIYEWDYDLNSKPVGITLFAPRSKFTYFIERQGALTSCSGSAEMCLPPRYQGRVYLPLTPDAVEPIWGTKDVNGRFDGMMITKLVFVLTDTNEKGCSFLLDDIGIHSKANG